MLFPARRCQSVPQISNRASDATKSHIDGLFCTTQSQSQHQQRDEDEVSQRSSSGISSSDSSRRHRDDEVTARHGVNDPTGRSRPRPTIHEMFCTETLTSDNSACLRTSPITDPTQHCASSADSDKKQVSQSVSQSISESIYKLQKLRCRPSHRCNDPTIRKCIRLRVLQS